MEKQFRLTRCISFLVGTSLIGCGSAEQTTMDPAFVDRLDRLGFFEYVSGTERDAAKRDLQNIGWAAVYGETGRLFPADAEALAEGGIGEFLREIQPFLASQGVTIKQIEDHFGEDGYSVSVNGKDHVIYDANELQRDEAQLGWTWGLATVRGFAIVNELLADTESNERLYAVNAGNDLFGFFLTPQLRDAVCDHPDATPRDRPYVPKDDHPWYGQEHD